MNEELNQQTTEQQTVTQTGENNTTQTEGAPSENEVKTFTQEEVDKIIEKRLVRERKKFEDQLKEYTGSPMERELNKREREVTKRELMTDAKIMLMEQEQPLELLDLLDYTDKEAMEESLNKVISIVKVTSEKTINNYLRGKGAPKAPTGGNMVDNAIRRAFGLK